MIHIPPEEYINNTLRVGSVYRFSAPEFIETDIPHYFIVVGIDEENNYMVCCTSQRDTKIKYFDNMGFDYQTLVIIEEDEDNGFTKETYVDCNGYFEITRSRLVEKLRQEVLNCTGEISYNHYDQIREGIKISYLNDLPEDLLVHPYD